MNIIKIVPFLFLVSTSFADEQVSDYFLCKKKTEVRSLRTVKASSENYLCFYTKLGVDEKVGQAKSPDRCRSILEQIKTTLTKVEWNCKEITSSQVTSDSGTTSN